MNLLDEIYKRGYNINTFSDKIGICRQTIWACCKGINKTRGDTIYLIANELQLPYETVKQMIEG